MGGREKKILAFPFASAYLCSLTRVLQSAQSSRSGFESVLEVPFCPASRLRRMREPGRLFVVFDILSRQEAPLMSLLSWLRRMARPSRKNNRNEGKRSHSKWDYSTPRLEALEDRIAPATDISVIAGVAGAGTLDSFLSASNGTITTANGVGAQTLSVGALQGVGPGVTISITASNTIAFQNFGLMALQTGTG